MQGLRRTGVMALAVAAALLIAHVASADQWSEKTILTFTEPVMIPGATLTRGRLARAQLSGSGCSRATAFGRAWVSRSSCSRGQLSDGHGIADPSPLIGRPRRLAGAVLSLGELLAARAPRPSAALSLRLFARAAFGRARGPTAGNEPRSSGFPFF